MSKLYLTRRNLLTLLSKLDRKKAGDDTACTIVKYKNPQKEFQQTMNSCAITAVEDDEYYTALNRPAGGMHPLDEMKLG
jgi:hypothetical protein